MRENKLLIINEALAQQYYLYKNVWKQYVVITIRRQ